MTAPSILALVDDEDAALLTRAGFDVRRMTGWPELGPADTLVVAVDEPDVGDALYGRNAFLACLAERRRDRVGRVFLLADEALTEVRGLAGFCLADGVVFRGADGLIGAEDLAGPSEREAGVSVDALLERLERDIEKRGEQAARRALERLRQRPDEGRLLDHLTDTETGLFDGPFATFKLDEEIKRSTRFHQPLSILLIDCGVTDWGEERGLVLAEIAGIFLEECRDIDVVARFDEATFLFLLPGTPPDGARSLAKRLLTSLREREFAGGVRVPARIGIAAAPGVGIRSGRDLLAAAESDLASS
jgi:diguanylate cyclase (GGDEF)-like protein